jgi:hypothetical protein
MGGLDEGMTGTAQKLRIVLIGHQDQNILGGTQMRLLAMVATDY